MLAGLPLCYCGHSVVPASWASALTAAGVLQALTGKSYWVISRLFLFVHRFRWALWPPCWGPVCWVSHCSTTCTDIRTQQGGIQAPIKTPVVSTWATCDRVLSLPPLSLLPSLCTVFFCPCCDACKLLYYQHLAKLSWVSPLTSKQTTNLETFISFDSMKIGSMK